MLYFGICASRTSRDDTTISDLKFRRGEGYGRPRHLVRRRDVVCAVLQGDWKAQRDACRAAELLVLGFNPVHLRQINAVRHRQNALSVGASKACAFKHLLQPKYFLTDGVDRDRRQVRRLQYVGEQCRRCK